MTDAVVAATLANESDIALQPISAPALYERITGHYAREYEPHLHNWRPSIIKGLNDQVCRTCLVYKSLWEEYARVLAVSKMPHVHAPKTPKQMFDEWMLALEQMIPKPGRSTCRTITEYQTERRRAAAALPPELAERLLTLMPASPEGHWSNYAGD